MTRRTALVLCAAAPLLLAAAPAPPAPRFVRPGPAEKCPVCGMFVARYTEWVAEIVFRDGSRAVFDGPKDFFRFYHEMGRYGSKKTPRDVAALYVTDYYDLRPLDAARAFYVVGSDVYGPMGEELIPFGTEAGARDFQKDHKGRRVVAFAGVRDELARLR